MTRTITQQLFGNRTLLASFLFAFVALMLANQSAWALSGGIAGRTNLSGGAGCTGGGCHSDQAADGGMLVTISGPTSLLAGAVGNYTVTSTKASLGSGVKMGVNIATNSGTLSESAANLIISGSEIIHNQPSGALNLTNAGGSASYSFSYTMPAGAAPGSNHTLYAVSRLGFGGAWNHAANFTVTTATPPPVITSAATASGTVGSFFSYTITATNSPTSFSASGLPSGLSRSGATISGTPTTAGTFNATISASNASGSDTNALTVTISKANQSINFPAQSVPSQPYSAGGAFGISPLATATSGLAIGYSSATPSVCSVSGVNVTIQSAGTCTITASQAGDANWNAATSVQRSVTITPLSQSIFFPAQTPALRTFVSGATFSINPLATGGASGNPVVYASASPTVCTVTGTNVTMASTGFCTVTANQAGNTNYTAAAQVQQSIQLAAASYTVTPSAAPGGSISPVTPIIVLPGQVVGFSVFADPGFVASVGGTCGGSLVNTVYTINPAAADCTVIAAFTPVSPVNFVATGSMSLGRYAHAALKLATGNVMVTGGVGIEMIDNVESYSPATGAWSKMAPMLTPRAQHAALVIDKSGTVLVMGGDRAPGFRGRSVEIYNPLTKSWSQFPSLNQSRVGSAAALVNNVVYITGGNNSEFEAYNLAAGAGGAWGVGPSMSVARFGHAMFADKAGLLVIAGDRAPHTVEFYSFVKNAWSGRASVPSAHEDQFAAAELADRRILVTGGTSSGSATSAAALYDRGADAWTVVAPMLEPRNAHTLTLLPDGRVLATGGERNGLKLFTAEIYDPASNVWSSAGNFVAARSAATATLLDDGRVLIAGGETSLGASALADLYVGPPALPRAAKGDLNGDGKSDVLAQSVDGSVVGLLMNGATSVGSATLLGPGTGFTVTHTGDLNGDGKADLLWRDVTNGSIVAWLMDGLSVTQGIGFAGAGSPWRINQVADFDGDGKADLLWRHDDGSIAVWLMDGLSLRGSALLLGPNTVWTVSHVGDLNGDGKADILWRHSDGSVAAWLMNGTTVTAGTSLLGPNGIWTHIDGTVAQWQMDGLVVSSGAVILGAGSGYSVSHVGDFNGDGKADLLWRASDGAVVGWLMNGGTVTAGAVLLGGSSGYRVMQLRDVNGDGKADLVWRNEVGAAAGTITVWTMNGLTITAGANITSPAFNVVP
jgi:hypothetical protein